MNIVLKNCQVVDSNSPFNLTVSDILIKDGKIAAIAEQLQTNDCDEVVEAEGLAVSPGWVDPFAFLCDPGYEHRETLESGAAAAAAGGYTRVFCVPNTTPVIDNKSQVQYVQGGKTNRATLLHPLGAISKHAEGKELAEMYDMLQAGAVAFTDGLKPVQSSALFLKALQYVRGFHGIVVQVPVDFSLSRHGLMNEGVMSTRMGMPGIPAIGEELMIKRDLELLDYTRSAVHFTGVSTEKGFNLIADAKDRGLNVTCSITPYHLFFCDEDLAGYDTMLKVLPPIRSRKDMLATRKAIDSHVVDCIATHHIPQDLDAKQCEFQSAGDCMIGLQTAFSVLNTALPGISETRLVQLLSTNARKIFRLPPATIAEGQIAELTIFTPSGTFTLDADNNRSKSANSPFMNRELKGTVLGVINKGILKLNKIREYGEHQ